MFSVMALSRMTSVAANAKWSMTFPSWPIVMSSDEVDVSIRQKKSSEIGQLILFGESEGDRRKTNSKPSNFHVSGNNLSFWTGFSSCLWLRWPIMPTGWWVLPWVPWQPIRRLFRNDNHWSNWFLLLMNYDWVASGWPIYVFYCCQVIPGQEIKIHFVPQKHFLDFGRVPHPSRLAKQKTATSLKKDKG